MVGEERHRTHEIGRHFRLLDRLRDGGEGACLETGFLVERAAASDVARLVDAVRRVARSL
jgi:hypothetical protein